MIAGGRMIVVVAVLLLLSGIGAAEGNDSQIESKVVKTEAQDMILVQEVVVEAPVSDVWRAYTTSAGWMAWAAPLAEVDLRAGGVIRTHYESGAKIGDAGTNTLHIVNYVPERVLTLRAEISERWPDVMQEDEGKLMNVIVFDAQSATVTRVQSYGVGYRDLPAYDDLMKFFIPANESLFKRLKEYLED